MALNPHLANRDAQVFQKYCQNLLGVPAENIEMVLDGSIGQMNEALRKISNIVEQERNAVVYFYYAGHGWQTLRNICHHFGSAHYQL